MAHSIGYLLHKFCKAHPEGSYKTQANRVGRLEQMMKQLKADGYRIEQLKSLKPKHTEHLVKTWQRQGLSPGTMKNRLSDLRWLGEKLGKPALVPASNSELGIDRRQYIPTESKAQELTIDKLSQVEDRYTEASLKLQAAFGLRCEESIKFTPRYAHRGSVVTLKGSWCKGGRPRTLEVRTEVQREALRYAREVAGSGALIPPDKNYIQQLRRFQYVTSNAEINKVHGFRHNYAQQRYKELTGREAPVNGGLSRKDMSPEEKSQDDGIRHLISQELGHERIEIVAQYIGS